MVENMVAIKERVMGKNEPPKAAARASANLPSCALGVPGLFLFGCEVVPWNDPPREEPTSWFSSIALRRARRVSDYLNGKTEQVTAMQIVP